MLKLYEKDMLDKEKKSWTNHKVIIKNGLESRVAWLTAESHITLCFQERTWHGVPYHHYFIITTPNSFVIEISGTDLFEACFEISDATMGRYYTETFSDGTSHTIFDDEMRHRLSLVEGMCNYSLVLRNCEHITKYVVYGKWFSMQVSNADTLFGRYLKVLNSKYKKLINTPPLGLHQRINELRSELTVEWVFTPLSDTASHCYEARKDSFNILLIGPTGSGKSNIINHIYQRNIAPSKMKALGVTQAIDLYPGTYKGPNSQGNICIVDTVGFCDKVMPLPEIIGLLEGVIKNQEIPIHRVAIVFGDRVRNAETDALLEYKKLLRFEDHLDKFTLVLTRCDDYGEAERQEYLSSFTSLPEFQMFANTGITAVSGQTGKTVLVPRAVCVGLKQFTKVKESEWETINIERESLLGSLLYFNHNPITFTQSCCSIL